MVVDQQNLHSLVTFNILVYQVLPLVEVEMEAGDALFFHCNLLHCSDKNDSDRRRWAFLIAYNRASNDPVILHHCPQYTKLEMVFSVTSSAILKPLPRFQTLGLKWPGDEASLSSMCEFKGGWGQSSNPLNFLSLCRFLILPFWIVPLQQIFRERTF